MSTLKELRIRIKSVKSTQKITSAMKMVATAKLRKSQEKMNVARVYTASFHKTLFSITQNHFDAENKTFLETGEASRPPLFLVIGTDRGLCGGYNSNIIKETRQLLKQSQSRHTQIVYVCGIGKKVQNALKREQKQMQHENIAFTHTPIDCVNIQFQDVEKFAAEIVEAFENQTIGTFDIITGHMKNILQQPIEMRQIVPLPEIEQTETIDAPYILLEPARDLLIDQMLKHNIAVQIYNAILENNACEHAARMTAMDNATRNAREMIDSLQLNYNQGRQAQITNELNEIIAGANAL